MVESVISYSIRNKFLILFSVIILTFASIWAVKNTALDALPDLSPPQVIVEVKWAGQSPKTIEEQVSYPLISNLMSLPNIDTVRAMSSFQNALIYIIFKDGTDLYDSRNRILEQLSQLQGTFPQGVDVAIGPDATGVGWAYEYALKSDTKSLDELRTLQDYYYKYALLGVDGVSEIASIGGFIKNYEITLNQDKLVQYDLSIKDVKNALSKNNDEKGGRIILENGFEHMIQAKGYLQSVVDIENITVKTTNSIPLKISDIAEVNITSSNRRGMADLNGEGDTVGGIVVVRYGENPYAVIKAVKQKLKTLSVDGVEVVETYDRTTLIDKAIDTLTNTLLEESIIVMIITGLFLFHFRSALIIIITLPLTVLITFLLMKAFGMGSNIMSLGGIAIAIGAMVDATIVMVENAHKYLQGKENISNEERVSIIIKSAKQVGRPIFFALILVVVSFLPIFALTGQEGRLFTPLAFTKSFAMISGAILSITIVPILMVFFIKGKIMSENKNWLNKFFIFLYSPLLKLSLKLRYFVVVAFVATIVLAYPVYKKQNWEFMPMMNETVFMYMPVTPYGLGIDLARELTFKTDKILKSFPEVQTVFGKAGRADTATDPAPLAMIETIVTFKPENEWRPGMTYKKLMEEMDKKLQVAGLINSWTYPIRGRIDMLLTGIRTPLGIKLYGNNHQKLEETAGIIEQKLKKFDKTLSVSTDKINSGYYLNINIDEEMISRYGINKNDILSTISLGVAGAKVSTFLDGLERYPMTLRFETTQREDITSLRNLQIKTKLGFQPLEMFAELKYEEGPSIIKSEKALNVNFIYITPKSGISAKQYKDEAKTLLEDIKLPSGFYYEWAGQSEYLESAMQRLAYIIPLTFILIFILIYFALKNITYTMIIFFTLPFALTGGIFYLDFLDFNISIAVIVGFLALLGVAAETSIVMIVYLHEAMIELKQKCKKIEKEDIYNAIYKGAVLRLRPKLMTLFAILGGLIPIMYINGVGSEVMQRIAAPMIGGMVSSAFLTLIVIPSIFYILAIKKGGRMEDCDLSH
ncbi:efflux RND transporter permease subunit [Poseidonibacter ostreae]|uniref:CusA/CzcA family heavy metal efflux RND transporter n=1 Tax=Poseidonibacter ostreae TaxID=2654171 RepID=A0A6L4WU18_9BACT|nr:CusA/CzcA family heavy metal efflux RND transporter [Poseidonibacter ostreae]KAB7887702.1 CusA/CzcA family heavy metal efflux RND transporter [Poseidonibacter ostreae]KAB7889684.1 CusA/CzcA family heavy metal efflux RND transporter [Poseidonibacter ostreae]KAB7892105.1 CusA/CzcA family heavy metal efflux RND transporter [Poseidonibacter ostreae]